MENTTENFLKTNCPHCNSGDFTASCVNETKYSYEKNEDPDGLPYYALHMKTILIFKCGYCGHLVKLVYPSMGSFGISDLNIRRSKDI